jgi:hypothetical protein
MRASADVSTVVIARWKIEEKEERGRERDKIGEKPTEHKQSRYRSLGLLRVFKGAVVKTETGDWGLGTVMSVHAR